jgi:hypothetical protein
MAACALLTALAIAQQLPPSAQPPPADSNSLGTIEGTAFGANHQPLPGTLVLLVRIPMAQQDSAPSGRPVEATSDTFGKFRFKASLPAATL